MGSALETLCGQAYGAKKLPMLGVYLQRSWLLLTATAVCMLPLYLFATPILRFFHQDDQIAVMAGRFSLYMVPQLFAYALNFPIQKFLQAQSKLMAMAAVSAAALVLHVALTWFLVVPMRMGLIGLAVALNASWWFVVLGQLAYIVMGYCPGAWNGFELDSLAFTELFSFARLSIGSAIMICLEFWFYMFLIVIVGNLPNAQVAVAAVSICTNLFGWQIMVFFGFNAAISVRVSNELGAGRPRAARFAIAVVLMSSVAIGVAFFVAVLLLRDVYGAPFTESPEVVHAVASLGVVFAFTWLVAYINLGCYYGVGIPVGYMIAFPLRRGIQGMWGGMLTGVGLQTVILIAITMRTNWNKEAIFTLKQTTRRRTRRGPLSFLDLLVDDTDFPFLFPCSSLSLPPSSLPLVDTHFPRHAIASPRSRFRGLFSQRSWLFVAAVGYPCFGLKKDNVIVNVEVWKVLLDVDWQHNFKTFYESVRVKISCKDPARIPAERLFGIKGKIYRLLIEVEPNPHEVEVGDSVGFNLLREMELAEDDEILSEDGTEDHDSTAGPEQPDLEMCYDTNFPALEVAKENKKWGPVQVIRLQRIYNF
ncbi:unnamed protein product [Triticum turgidum subsp. durum]|uniref:Protein DETOXIFICATION n=1 Tax=Triticum turgidum subsp. durum TaxID=4567 RepID=A0A9R1BN65_TRITD|nr:unnamed protein product [Triticum turgidum subsp. durum]